MHGCQCDRHCHHGHTLSHGHFTRHSIKSLVLPSVKMHGKKGFMYNRAFRWNELPPTVQDSSNLVTLKKHCKNHLLNSMYHYF